LSGFANGKLVKKSGEGYKLGVGVGGGKGKDEVGAVIRALIRRGPIIRSFIRKRGRPK
jgi:hypothetical protein